MAGSWHQKKQRLGHRLAALMDHRRAVWLLFVASILETLIVPIPIETILIPWMVLRPQKRWWLASVALAGNLLAAAVGYGLGVWAMGQFNDQLIGLFGGQQAFNAFDQRFSDNGFLAVLSIGVIPIPFQIAMLVAGSTGYSFFLFMLAALLARGARYFGLALLVHFFGDKALKLWKRNERTMMVLLGVAVAGYLIYKGMGLWSGGGSA
ncbi:YqaA family protein [Kushneria marisflavi]|uniref:Alkaline phosphatase n=1 Tax=Kushneria marisflavi TaxID=157779 RepID=A0A240UPN8_9GAMM|nr:VTT domain-containing protein [Kushneria marisflavi]ART63451.1 alkaline phosphatase [Kushneria marisflavi]RKD84509.1 membrane protein YqaA with SNARE-associated domain [Kushneria marisflavi]